MISRTHYITKCSDTEFKCSGKEAQLINNICNKVRFRRGGAVRVYPPLGHPRGHPSPAPTYILMAVRASLFPGTPHRASDCPPSSTSVHTHENVLHGSSHKPGSNRRLLVLLPPDVGNSHFLPVLFSQDLFNPPSSLSATSPWSWLI